MEQKLPFWFYFERQNQRYVQWGKRLLDVAGSFILLLLLAIPMAMIAVLIKLSSPGPVLFRDERLGLGGKPFRMFKFRSMRDGKQRVGPGQTEADRVTPIGRWIRKTHLDELPQLLNVVLGEMSLVGPRPMPVDEHRYWRQTLPEFVVKVSVRPGITGLAQIQPDHDWTSENGERLFAFDRVYVRSINLWNDILILFLTTTVVLRRHGH